MNTEIKQKWVAALRSGNYNQGVNTLRKGNNFCCLGVLCDVVDPKGWKESQLFKTSKKYGYGINEVTSTLPYEIMQFAGLTDRNPTLTFDDKDLMVSQLNDKGITFEEIANLIEEQL